MPILVRVKRAVTPRAPRFAVKVKDYLDSEMTALRQDRLKSKASTLQKLRKKRLETEGEARLNQAEAKERRRIEAAKAGKTAVKKSLGGSGGKLSGSIRLVIEEKSAMPKEKKPKGAAGRSQAYINKVILGR